MKDLSSTNSKDCKKKVSDLQIYGNPDTWICICKASSKSGNWMKSTKAMSIPGLGVLVQVSTQQDNNVAEALHFIPGAAILTDEDDQSVIVGLNVALLSQVDD